MKEKKKVQERREGRRKKHEKIKRGKQRSCRKNQQRQREGCWTGQGDWMTAGPGRGTRPWAKRKDR